MLKKFKIIKRKEYKNIVSSKKKLALQLNFLKTVESKNFQYLVKYLDYSKSQFLQDLFVLNFLNYKCDGYFVEFGATNGIDLSNSFLMEKEFNWRGILAEPSRSWHQELKSNRTCDITTDCVWKISGDNLPFLEANIAEYSSLSESSTHDKNMGKRKNARKYNVNTISLNDLLLKYNAPENIDYLSIDTEGSEYEILKNFNFNDYNIKIITCEHNYGENRDKIFSLMLNNGYTRIYENISYCDDWYVRF